MMIEGHWGPAERRDEYKRIYDRLPLFGGRPEAEMTTVLRKIIRMAANDLAL
jgi:hypothetical protein